MNAPVAIPLPLAHVGSVNAWLLRGDPVTLIDTGPRDDDALAALEDGLRREGLRVEDIELLLATHHHLDHVGLAATIQRRSGATVAVLDRGGRLRRALRRRGRGGPAVRPRADGATTAFPSSWSPTPRSSGTTSAATTEDFRADVRLADGDRVRAGGRSLRVVARPGHSTTDTLFVDDARRRSRSPAITCWRRSPPTRRSARPTGRTTGARARACATWRTSSARAQMPLARLLTGHGAPVTEHRRLVDARLRDHRRRCERILAILDDGPAHGVRDRRRPVARADGDASSRCSSSGRWSATSSCCWTPAPWPSGSAARARCSS